MAQSYWLYGIFAGLFIHHADIVSAFICYGWLSPYKELHVAAILVLLTLTDDRPQDRAAE